MSDAVVLLQGLSEKIQQYLSGKGVPEKRFRLLSMRDRLGFSPEGELMYLGEKDYEAAYENAWDDALKIKQQHYGLAKLPPCELAPIIGLRNLLEWCTDSIGKITAKTSTASGEVESEPQHLRDNGSDKVVYVGAYFDPQTGKTYTGKEAHEQSGKDEKLLREKLLQAGYTITTTMAPPANGAMEGNLQMTLKTAKPDNPMRDVVFICYSHKDKKWLNDLQTHLKPYVRNGSVTAWSDKQIATGSKWFPEIERVLASAKAAVLLVTSNFLASDFIHEHELGPLLKRAEKGDVCIVWIPIRACAYKKTPLKDYQAAWEADKPLAEMKTANRDKAWVEICEKIRDAVAS